MSANSGDRTARAPSAGSSLCAKLLPSVLSLVAGSSDAIGFVGLRGLFTAHITGNLVILAAHVVDGGTAPLAPMLSVPVFMAALGLTRLLAGALETRRQATLQYGVEKVVPMTRYCSSTHGTYSRRNTRRN